MSMAAAVLTRNDVVARAKTLKAIAGLGSLWGVVSHWGQIATALVVFYIYPSWWLYVPLFLFISARQYGLAILLHDAQHGLLHRDKSLNRLFGTWLIAAPLGTEFASSQSSHLDHHFHFGSADRDPDFALYCFGNPSPKQSTLQIAVLFVGKLMGGKVGEMLHKSDRMAANMGSETAATSVSFIQKAWRSGLQLWTVICVHLLLLAVLTFAFGWWGYPALWALPLATFAAFYNDFRIFCEHSLIGRDAAAEERMTSFVSNPVERFFFAPNHMNYHAEHHMFPYVPHRYLPELREAVRACPELDAQVQWRRSYVGHLIAYIRGARLQALAEHLPDAPQSAASGRQ